MLLYYLPTIKWLGQLNGVIFSDIGVTWNKDNFPNFNKSNWTTQGLLTNYEQLLKVKILDFKKRLEKLIDLVNRNNGKVIFVSQSERRKYDFINNKLLGTNNIIEINDTYAFNAIQRHALLLKNKIFKINGLTQERKLKIHIFIKDIIETLERHHISKNVDKLMNQQRKIDDKLNLILFKLNN